MQRSHSADSSLGIRLVHANWDLASTIAHKKRDTPQGACPSLIYLNFLYFSELSELSEEELLEELLSELLFSSVELEDSALLLDLELVLPEE